MLKQVKWNKKRKWSETRYAKHFHARGLIRMARVAQIASCAAAHLSAIASQTASDSLSEVEKRAAAWSVAVDAIDNISSEITKGLNK